MLIKIRNMAIILAFFIASWGGVSYAQENLEAKKFEDKCWREGAANVVDEITRDWDNPVWEKIIDNISSGDEAWIRTLYCIRGTPGYSNATVTLDIHIAMATALPKNPRAVLALGLSGVSTTRACSLPFVEPERAWAAQYVKDTLAALEAIPDDASFANILLDIERDVCILRLKDAYAKKYDYAD